jgi:hypothetical protein
MGLPIGGGRGRGRNPTRPRVWPRPRGGTLWHSVLFRVRRVWRGLLVSALSLPGCGFHPCPLPLLPSVLSLPLLSFLPPWWKSGPLELPLCCRYRLSIYSRALPESTHPGCCNCWQCRRARGSERKRERVVGRDSAFRPPTAERAGVVLRVTAIKWASLRECGRVW